jgi:hypothetical protein
MGILEVDGNRGQGGSHARLKALETSMSARIDAQIVWRAFGETANPEDYVARPACERILRAIDRIVFKEAQPVALIAPPGMGKSLLLRVFARRRSGRATAIELLYGSMSFDELSEWILQLLGEPVGDDPTGELERMLGARELLLTIDDASSLPEDTAQRLGELARLVAPRLRIAFAAMDSRAASSVFAAFGEPLQRVHLLQPMDIRETRRYMLRRLAACGAGSELTGRLTRGMTARELRLSRGVPRRVHNVAEHALLPVTQDPSDQKSDEEWLGAPLEELGLER